MASRELWITDQKVAVFLMDREKSRHLDPFLGQDCTLKGAAAQLGLGKTRMSYWVTRLCALGLIEVVRTELHLRHRVRIYRSVADSFVLPLELLPATDVEVLEHYFKPVWQQFLVSLSHAGRKNASGWHVRLLRRAALPSFQIVPNTGDLEDARIYNAWARLSLTVQQAAELRAELKALLERYAAQEMPEAKRHLLHLATVEIAPE